MNIVGRWTEIWSLYLNRRTAIFISALLYISPSYNGCLGFCDEIIFNRISQSFGSSIRLQSDFLLKIARCDRERESGEINCPDIRQKGPTLLRQSQLVLTRLLRIFDLIAKKHGIRYWLYRGTLLGAVRHHGHNPFDNDVDICIPKADFEKFIKYGVSELPDDIFFQTEQTDSHYKVPFQTGIIGKLRDRKSCYKTCTICQPKDGLMLDMFVVESDSDGNFLELYSNSNWFMRRFIYGPTVRKPSEIFPLAKVTFDGFLFPAPRKWKKILKSFYGRDFMTIPYGNPPGHIIIDVSRSCEELDDTGNNQLIKLLQTM